MMDFASIVTHVLYILILFGAVKHYLPLDGILQILIYVIWAFWTRSDNRYFEIQTLINDNSVKRYMGRFIRL